MKFFRDLVQFLKDTANDPRIPQRDKRVLITLLALVASPFDVIPDWIPIFGVLDDVVIIAIICDYFFNKLDLEVLLSHYPWGMNSYIRVRRTARFIALITPSFIKNRIWKYQGSIYKG
jgi:uncharacterized membrane protein YkvA (DUF1232 family)